MPLEARFWLEAVLLFAIAFSVPIGFTFWIYKFIIKPSFKKHDNRHHHSSTPDRVRDLADKVHQ